MIRRSSSRRGRCRAGTDARYSSMVAGVPTYMPGIARISGASIAPPNVASSGVALAVISATGTGELYRTRNIAISITPVGAKAAPSAFQHALEVVQRGHLAIHRSLHGLGHQHFL